MQRLLYTTVITFIIITAYWPAFLAANSSANGGSAVGDPGMRIDGLRVAFEGWNFCNEVGEEAPGMGSPRAADCFDLTESKLKIEHHISDFIFITTLGPFFYCISSFYLL